ncbi:mannose-1-phosphate guanyltransferase, partial [bacterium (Candidatus Gribaldobacteria) CG10_big_fil_rev_8_21_14_0_10_37_21]
MISKVVIAAAGQGTRMKHLSQNKSKHLICVKEKPFLCYLMDNLIKAGYQDIILVVGFCADL